MNVALYVFADRFTTFLSKLFASLPWLACFKTMMAKVKAKPTSCACWNSPLPRFLAQEPLPFKRDNYWLSKQQHPLEKTRWLKQPVDLQQLILLVVWLSSFSAQPLDDCQIDLAVNPWCYSWWWDLPWCVPCVLWWESLSSGFACWHLVSTFWWLRFWQCLCTPQVRFFKKNVVIKARKGIGPGGVMDMLFTAMQAYKASHL